MKSISSIEKNAVDVEAFADLATIREALGKPDCPYSPLDMARAIIVEHGLTLDRREHTDSDGTDVSYWEASMDLGRGVEQSSSAPRIDIPLGDDGRWVVEPYVDDTATYTADQFRYIAAQFARASAMVDDLNLVSA